MKFRSIINYSKVLKGFIYSKKWIKRSENASVNKCLHVLVTSWLKVGLTMHYKWLFGSQIKGQWIQFHRTLSSKCQVCMYKIKSIVMTLNSHVWYTLYSVCSLCSIAYYNYVAEFLNHLKYKLLNCLTFDALLGVNRESIPDRSPITC